MNTMKTVLADITDLTTTIETKYPELYQFLDENPMTIPIHNHPNIDSVVLKEYLESLKGLLQHHLETHTKNQTPPHRMPG